MIADLAAVLGYLGGHGRRFRLERDGTFLDQRGSVCDAAGLIALANERRRRDGLPPYALEAAPAEQPVP